MLVAATGRVDVVVAAVETAGLVELVVEGIVVVFIATVETGGGAIVVEGIVEVVVAEATGMF